VDDRDKGDRSGQGEPSDARLIVRFGGFEPRGLSWRRRACTYDWEIIPS